MNCLSLSNSTYLAKFIFLKGNTLDSLQVYLAHLAYSEDARDA